LPKRTPKPEKYISVSGAGEFHTRQIAAFDNRYHPHPMPRKWWSARLSELDPDTLVHIAFCDHTRKIFGYAVSYWPITGKAVSITRLLVAPDKRRAKIATRLMLSVKAAMPPMIDKLQFVVPELDLDTQLFLRHLEFKARLPLKANAFPGYANENGISFVWRGNK
jgi:GNAT superfamily N-acetyltransferase